jgi:hypothetical protein
MLFIYSHERVVSSGFYLMPGFSEMVFMSMIRNIISGFFFNSISCHYVLLLFALFFKDIIATTPLHLQVQVLKKLKLL